jgi:hypothetical protein
MNEEFPIQIESDSENVFIKIPVDALIKSQENNDVLPLRVTDAKAMLVWIEKNLPRMIGEDLVKAYTVDGVGWLQGLPVGKI